VDSGWCSGPFTILRRWCSGVEAQAKYLGSVNLGFGFVPFVSDKNYVMENHT